MKGEGKGQGLLSTMLSFVSYGPNLPSLMENKSSNSVWFAYAVLLAETQYLEEMNLLRAVSQELAEDRDMTPDAALKVINSLFDIYHTFALLQQTLSTWPSKTIDICESIW